MNDTVAAKKSDYVEVCDLIAVYMMLREKGVQINSHTVGSMQIPLNEKNFRITPGENTWILEILDGRIIHRREVPSRGFYPGRHEDIVQDLLREFAVLVEDANVSKAA